MSNSFKAFNLRRASGHLDAALSSIQQAIRMETPDDEGDEILNLIHSNISNSKVSLDRYIVISEKGANPK